MEISEHLVRLFQIIKEIEGLDLFSGASKLSRTEFRLLREVIMESEKGREIISSELARRLGVTRSAVSQLVTKLEERDIVKRTPSPTDRKIAYIRLSEHALGAFEEQCRQANAIMDEVAARLGERKLNSLLKLYGEFISVFSTVKREVVKG